MVKKVLARAYVAFILLLMYLPILLLIVFSFLSSEVVGIVTPSDYLTLELYGKLFRNQAAMQALFNTLLVGFSSAAVSTVLGTLGAIGVYYMRQRAKQTMELVTQLPVINAEIVMALSLAILFIVLGWQAGFLTLLIGHVVLTVAFVYLSVKPKLQQMDPSIYEAALDLGAKPGYAMRKVIFPEILPGIVSGFLLALTLSLDDFIITLFLKAPSFETLSTYVENQLRIGIPPEIRALTTLIFLFAVGVFVFNGMRTKAEAKKKTLAFHKEERK
jgi:spermidine/putrescine transport system permease protein